MIQLKVVGDGFEAVQVQLDVLARPNLAGLAFRLRDIMIRDNREGLTAGTNADGSPAEALAPSTIKRGRGGSGPPRVPRSAASRMIADYQVDIQPEPNRVILIGEWPNTPFVHFHASGAPANNMPARNPVGIRPQGQDEIREAIGEFVRNLLGGD